MDDISAGRTNFLRRPAVRWVTGAVAAGVVAAAAIVIATSGGGASRPPRPSTAAAAAAPSPTAAPGTLLLGCGSANWGKLASGWQAQSLRAGPLWFVGARRTGYVHYPGTGGDRLTIARHHAPTVGVMILEVADGSTVIIRPAAGSRRYFRFLDGFDGTAGNRLPDGDTGFTFSPCRTAGHGDNGPVTDYYLGFSLKTGHTAPVDVMTSPSARPIRLIFTSPAHGT